MGGDYVCSRPKLPLRQRGNVDMDGLLRIGAIPYVVARRRCLFGGIKC